MGKLSDKVTVVTGAGRGIGRAIAIVYAREGARVVVASRTPANVDRVVEEIRAEGGEAIGVPCDVGRRDEVFELIRRSTAELGTVDVLVNNAQGFGTEAEPSDVDRLHRRSRTSTTPSSSTRSAPAPLAHAVGHAGRVPDHEGAGPRQDHQLHVDVRDAGTTGNTAYNMTKEAVRALSRTAANEWGQHGINVNVISPTLRTDAFEAWERDRPEFVRALREALPMRRLGDPIAGRRSAGRVPGLARTPTSSRA